MLTWSQQLSQNPSFKSASPVVQCLEFICRVDSTFVAFGQAECKPLDVR